MANLSMRTRVEVLLPQFSEKHFCFTLLFGVFAIGVPFCLWWTELNIQIPLTSGIHVWCSLFRSWHGLIVWPAESLPSLPRCHVLQYKKHWLVPFGNDSPSVGQHKEDDVKIDWSKKSSPFLMYTCAISTATAGQLLARRHSGAEQLARQKPKVVKNPLVLRLT